MAKDLWQQKDDGNKSLENEGVFLVQSNIEDLLEETDNEKYDLEEENKGQVVNENNTVEGEHNIEQDDNVTKLQKQKLDEIEQSMSKQNSKKSKITNLIFFILNIVVVGGLLIYQISKESFVPLTGIKLNAFPFLIVCLLFLGTILMDTFGVSYLIKQGTGRWRFATAYKVTQIGKYYDAVTPMATGGQPFQITYLKSHGVPIHNSLSIPLAKYVFGQISWVVLSLVCLIISFTDKSYGTFVSIMSIIGFVLSFIVLSATIFLSVCKTVGKKLVVRILKLLYKMKIVKNYDKQYEKITKYIGDFQDVMKQYAKSPKDFIIMFFSTLVSNLIRYSIPFFVVGIFVPNIGAEYYLKLLVMTVLVDLSASFFPMPGGTGLNEISFTAAFGGVIESFQNSGYIGEVSGILIWVLLIWRFFSYYLYLIQGVTILSYDIAYGNKKYKWLVKKENLVEESMVFKQNQINKFRAERAKRRKNKHFNEKNREFI